MNESPAPTKALTGNVVSELDHVSPARITGALLGATCVAALGGLLFGFDLTGLLALLGDARRKGLRTQG